MVVATFPDAGGAEEDEIHYFLLILRLIPLILKLHFHHITANFFVFRIFRIFFLGKIADVLGWGGGRGGGNVISVVYRLLG